MRIYAYLLFFLAALLISTAAAEDDDDDDDYECAKCFDMPCDPVCSKEKGTFRNPCEMECKDAVLEHNGACTYEDLLRIYTEIE